MLHYCRRLDVNVACHIFESVPDYVLLLIVFNKVNKFFQMSIIAQCFILLTI